MCVFWVCVLRAVCVRVCVGSPVCPGSLTMAVTSAVSPWTSGQVAAVGHGGTGALQEPHPQLHPGLHRGGGRLRHHKSVSIHISTFTSYLFLFVIAVIFFIGVESLEWCPRSLKLRKKSQKLLLMVSSVYPESRNQEFGMMIKLEYEAWWWCCFVSFVR